MAIDISEMPVPPRKRHPSFYFVLLFAVAPVWSAVPLSWLFVVYSPQPPKIPSLRAERPNVAGSDVSRGESSLGLWSNFADRLPRCLFSVYYYFLTHQVSWSSPGAPANIMDLHVAFKRVLKTGLAALPEEGGDEESLASDRPGSPSETIEKLAVDDPRAIDYRNHVRTWYVCAVIISFLALALWLTLQLRFRKVPFSYIHLEQVRAWMYWSTFNCALPPRSEIQSRITNSSMRPLHSSRNELVALFHPDLIQMSRPILLTVDPMNVCARPLTWYLFVKFANICLRTWYERNHDVKYGRFKDLE